MMRMIRIANNTKWSMPIVSRLNQNFNVNMQILTWILDVYYMILFSQLTL